MSQLLLQVQLRLQSLKQEKNQSAQWISESLDCLSSLEEEDEEPERDEEELGEAMASLVLLHFFYLRFNQVRGETSERFYSRRHKYVQAFFKDRLPIRKETFPAFPVLSLVSAYPLGVVCKCGRLLSTETFGILPSCLSCLGMGRRPTYWPGHLAGDVDLAHIPRAWHDWAESVAIQLETKRKKLRSQTAIESLTSEKQND